MAQRWQLVVWGTSILLAGSWMTCTYGQEKAVRSDKERPTLKADAAAKPPLNSQAPVEPRTGKRSAEEEAIRLGAEQFVKAFANADAKAIANQFAPDAEYIDDEGNLYEGREEIETAFKTCFTEKPGSKIEINIGSIRIVSPLVAMEDGTTTVTTGESQEGVETRYAAVHVKQNDRWLIASVREAPIYNSRPHRSQLEQLSWLQGDWVDEGGDGSVVLFSCAPAEGGNFLIRKFSIHIAGEPAMTGEQRIGWDPLTNKLRAWIFDSEGGYGDGFWFRDDQSWILKTVGVTGDGRSASSTTFYKMIDAHRMTWQSVNHEIGGIQLPDSDPVTIVRRGPLPEVNVSDKEAVTSRSTR